jgi:hypothetical protein
MTWQLDGMGESDILFLYRNWQSVKPVHARMVLPAKVLKIILTIDHGDQGSML